LLKKTIVKIEYVVNFYYTLAINYLVNAECINTNIVPF